MDDYNAKTKNLTLIVSLPIFVVALCIFIYGCYLVAKTVSYKLFYKDMVKATITEMVKKEALK